MRRSWRRLARRHTENVTLLTLVVPAFNAQGYLTRALEPLRRITGDVEVIIVDDGSTDATGEIADGYASARPDVFRVIHQENKGHGGAINTGLAAARGRYLKVLDADDWLSVPALERAVATLRVLEEDGGVDAMFTDYIHDRVGKSNKTTRFHTVFPAERTFRWEETERFTRRQVLMMHAITYRTELLRRVGLELPEHTFYVDNLFVLVPLAQVRRMYYLPVGLYHYHIGRADQSVNPEVMVSRVDQQLRVNLLALQTLPSADDVRGAVTPPRLHAALLHYVEAICAVTSATLARSGTAEHLMRRQRFWSEVKAENPWLYARVRRSLLGASSNLPGQAGRHVTSIAYSVARRVVGFS